MKISFCQLTKIVLFTAIVSTFVLLNPNTSSAKSWALFGFEQHLDIATSSTPQPVWDLLAWRASTSPAFQKVDDNRIGVGSSSGFIVEDELTGFNVMSLYNQSAGEFTQTMALNTYNNSKQQPPPSDGTAGSGPGSSTVPDEAGLFVWDPISVPGKVVVTFPKDAPRWQWSIFGWWSHGKVWPTNPDTYIPSANETVQETYIINLSGDWMAERSIFLKDRKAPGILLHGNHGGHIYHSWVIPNPRVYSTSRNGGARKLDWRKEEDR